MRQPESPFKGKTLLEPKELVTPFGEIETPRLELPPLTKPTLDDRRRKALGHALGDDLADIVGIIPYAGGLLADSLRAMHRREIKNLLTPAEYEKYLNYDKQYPDTLAALRTFIEEG